MAIRLVSQETIERALELGLLRPRAAATNLERQYRPDGPAENPDAPHDGETRDQWWARLAERRKQEAQRPPARREPGWRVPAELRNTWPLYRNEAVTFTTEWGLVTVGRSLARIYDLGGWPDAETLRSMAEQQAERNGGPGGAVR